jgi:hypothetical protein
VLAHIGRPVEPSHGGEAAVTRAAKTRVAASWRRVEAQTSTGSESTARQALI